MNFYKIFLVLSILVAAIITHSEAGFLKKIGKKIEGVGKRTLGATSKTLVVAQQAADVAATASKG